jgi:DNA-binding helix-turn-helix protein
MGGLYPAHLRIFWNTTRRTPQNRPYRLNNNNTSCQYSGGYVVNQLSDKLIEQYEKRLAEKDRLIAYLQKELEELKR